MKADTLRWGAAHIVFIAVLLALDLVRVWHLFVFSLLTGVGSVFDRTLRSALVIGLVAVRMVLRLRPISLKLPSATTPLTTMPLSAWKRPMASRHCGLPAVKAGASGGSVDLAGCMGLLGLRSGSPASSASLKRPRTTQWPRQCEFRTCRRAVTAGVCTRLPQACRHRCGLARLQRIAGRHQPPDIVQLQAL